MYETLVNLSFVLSRYLHVVATTLIVGGTLFFELVVPLAIGDLKTEVQLALFARMRWIFRWVVYSCTVVLLLTGLASIYRNYSVLNGEFVRFLAASSSEAKIQQLISASFFNWPRPWFIAHLISGVLSLVIAVALVAGGRPPEKPIQWMRLNLFILLLAVFLASASRGARQNLFQAVLQHQAIPSARD